MCELPVDLQEAALRMTASPFPGRQLQQLLPPPSWKRTVRCASVSFGGSPGGQMMFRHRGRLTPIADIDYADDKFGMDVFSCESW